MNIFDDYYGISNFDSTKKNEQTQTNSNTQSYDSWFSNSNATISNWNYAYSYLFDSKNDIVLNFDNFKYSINAKFHNNSALQFICEEDIQDKSILICIFNYKHDDNAQYLLNSFSPYFETVVLDSGNDHDISTFMQFPNIYYGGLFNEAKKLSLEGSYDYVGIITSDVLISQDNINKIINRIKWVLTTTNIGVFGILGDQTGHSNDFKYSKSGNFRYIEGFFQFIKSDVLNNVPYVDLSMNQIGYGIDYLTCFLSKKLNYLNLCFDDINIFHPKDKGYDKSLALSLQHAYYDSIKLQYSDFVNDVIYRELIDKSIENYSLINYKNSPDGLTIIITAYNTADYIEQTLESIYSQDWIKTHNNFEVLVGIDGCEATLLLMMHMMHRFKNIRVFNMDSNQGTFITSNVIISLSRYNKILRFDSDDFFTSEKSISKMIECYNNGYDIVTFHYKDYINDNNIKNIDKAANGSVLYSKEVFNKAGGFKAWKCSGDYEFFERVKNSFKVFELREYIYNHRVRKNSLMHKKDTGMLSEYRANLNNQVAQYNFKKGDDIFIFPSMNNYTEIMGYKSIIVSMTSWPKRINNVEKVINSILVGNEQPDMIVVNLSVKEFPNKEKDLPNNLLKLINENYNIRIKWLKNNSLVWKKSIPTMIDYPDSYVICIDDDFYYPEDFVLTFKEKIEDDKPLTGVIYKNHGYNLHCGCSSLDKLKWIEPWIYQINENILKTGDEDSTMTYLYMLNGIEMNYVGKNYLLNMKAISLNNAYSTDHNLSATKTWAALEKTYKK